MSDYLVQNFLDNIRDSFNDKVAVNSPTEKITFKQLCRSSNKLAHCLEENDVGRQDRVALCLKRSPKSIIAMLGVLKADAIYVPIDANTPQGRFLKLLNDCSPKAIICDRFTLNKIQKINSLVGNKQTITVLENSVKLSNGFHDQLIYQEQIDTYPDTQLESTNIDTDIAYILYTSGTTGSPKGVMVSHLNVINYINWAVKYFEITADDTILSTAPFHFDMSVFDIYCALKAKTKLAIATEDLLLFPKRLIEFMEKENITIWKGVSSLLMYMARTGNLEKCNVPKLRKILFAGEVLPTKYLIKWMQSFPEKEFYNVYGPTEATGISTFYKIPQIPKNPQVTIPIGKPCTNTDVFILKENNALAKNAEVGELCIRGSSLSAGYWNDVEKTKKSFVPNPLTSIHSDRIYRTGDLAKLNEKGDFEYIGRKDHQIKWMGYRIELGEIESTLLSIDEVKDVSVILIESNKSYLKELVAFVELDNKESISIITKKLGEQIPHYMLPKKIIAIEKIPRSDRGKIDRYKLKEYFTEYSTYKI